MEAMQAISQKRIQPAKVWDILLELLLNPAISIYTDSMSPVALTMFLSGMLVAGFLLCDRFIEGNLMGSRIKKTGCPR